SYCLAGRFRDAAVAMMDASPRPLDAAALENRLGVEPGSVAKWFGATANGDVVTVDDGHSFTTDALLARLSEAAVALVEAHHAGTPHERGISRETVRAPLGERSGRDAAEAALRRAVAGGRLAVVDQGILCTPRFADQAHRSSDDAAAKALAVLE